MRMRSLTRAGIGAAVVVSAMLLLGACGDSDAGSATFVEPTALAPQSTTSTAPTTVPPTTTTTLPPLQLTNSAKISTAGLGPVRIGMTVKEAERLTGVTLVADEIGDNSCRYHVPDRGVTGVGFMVADGEVVRVDVWEGAISTLSGIGIGSTADEITELFGTIRMASTWCWFRWTKATPTNESSGRSTPRVWLRRSEQDGFHTWSSSRAAPKISGDGGHPRWTGRNEPTRARLSANAPRDGIAEVDETRATSLSRSRVGHGGVSGRCRLAPVQCVATRSGGPDIGVSRRCRRCDLFLRSELAGPNGARAHESSAAKRTRRGTEVRRSGLARALFLGHSAGPPGSAIPGAAELVAID